VRLQGENLQVLLNGSDVTGTIPAVNDTNEEDSTLVNLERTAENSIASSFRNGVSITVSVSFGLLSFVATVPEDFQGNATGLLGNFNGDSSDDFIFRSGTMLDDNPSDRQIHDFGQSCECCTIVIY
jgi:hypothetical protein